MSSREVSILECGNIRNSMLKVYFFSQTETVGVALLSAGVKYRNQRLPSGLLIGKKYLRIMSVVFLLVMLVCSGKYDALAIQGERISGSLLHPLIM